MISVEFSIKDIQLFNVTVYVIQLIVETIIDC